MPELTADQQQALLARHRPVLRYDLLEPYFATGTEALFLLGGPGPEAVWSHCVLQRPGEDAPYALSTGAAGHALAQAFAELASGTDGIAYADGRLCEIGDSLSLRPTGERAVDYRHAGAVQQERYGHRIYGRVVPSTRPGGGWWLQYWLFYLVNDRFDPDAGGPIHHEGDWEMVQVRVPPADADPGRPADAPAEVTYSQHEGASRRRWGLAKRQDGRLVVFAARGTHACYPRRTHWIFDRTDGRFEADPVLERINEGAAWPNWPGRWGGGRGSPEALGPRPAWRDPDGYHAAAKGIFRSFLARRLQDLLRGLRLRWAAWTGRRREGLRARSRRLARGERPMLPVPPEMAPPALVPSADSRVFVSDWPVLLWQRPRRRVEGWWADERDRAVVRVVVREPGLALSIRYLLVRIASPNRLPRVYTWKVDPGDLERGFVHVAALPWDLDEGAAHRLELRGASLWGIDEALIGRLTLGPRRPRVEARR